MTGEDDGRPGDEAASAEGDAAAIDDEAVSAESEAAAVDGDVSADDAPATPTTREERRELALDLLAHIEDDELPLSDVVDRVETVTTDPSLVREILDAAELRGIIDREDGRVRTRRGGTFVRFESQVVTREGEFDCRRCGASISTGHFVRFDAGELGPFGSSCVRKVTGRE